MSRPNRNPPPGRARPVANGSSRSTAARTRLGPPPLLARLAPLALAAATLLVGCPLLVAAQTAEDPSNVVLVFDVSNSILLSDDGTNSEFAQALEDIADRVEASADELAIGNAEISFVVFGRTAITYPNGCGRLALNENPAAIRKLESCLRAIADEYRAGPDAPVRQRLNTVNTDHVAALREAADLLPNETTRSAVVFFTDGQHDPPGTARDDENVVREIAAAYEGQTPLAILPVGLGSRAGAFETELRAIYDAYFRDMEPCEGRTTFSWPTVVFPEAEQAGIAVAQALQEVTCSFTFAPPPTAEPTPIPTPTPPPPPGAPLNVQLLSGNESITIQWLPPEDPPAPIVDYLVQCRPVGSEDWIQSSEGVSTTTETEITGLTPGVSYECQVAATDGTNPGPYAQAAAPVIALGIPVTPGQPRIETGDASARVTVDPVTEGAPPEQYVFECSNAAGPAGTGTGTAADHSAVVQGLANGDTFTCVAYAENRIGRSPASVASASFSPCGGIFECQPWTKFAVIGLVVLGGLAVAWYAYRRYSRRNRVWVTAQVDGGANLPLGWGPEIGIQLERDESGGWFASVRPFATSDITAQYQGAERFLVTSKAGIKDVHQGDPAPVRDEEGRLHQLILRRYRQKPQERVTAAPADAKQGSELGERLEGKDDAPPEEKVDFVG